MEDQECSSSASGAGHGTGTDKDEDEYDEERQPLVSLLTTACGDSRRGTGALGIGITELNRVCARTTLLGSGGYSPRHGRKSHWTTTENAAAEAAAAAVESDQGKALSPSKLLD